MPFKVKEETKGGIIIAQETLDRARVATQVGYVLKMGDLCYKDKEKYPTGPWCKRKRLGDLCKICRITNGD